MHLPYIDRIWRIRGSLPLDAPQSRGQSPREVFDKLGPLFTSKGTDSTIDGDTLTYSNKNPAAQDKLATFNRGTLRVVGGPGGSKLTYDLTSPALLFCFLAPLLFLSFALVTIGIGEYQKQAEAAMSPAEKKAAEEKKKKEEEKAKHPQPLNPIDVMLGAPAPEPKKDEEEKEKGKKDGKDKKEEESKGPSPTPAYVFAGLFGFLYLVGRFLEPWLIRREFRRHLSGEATIEGEPHPAE